MRMKTQPVKILGAGWRHKIFLREKCTTLIIYIKKIERSQINNLMMHLKVLEKQDQIKSKSGS